MAADLTAAQVQAVTDALTDKAAKDPNIQAALNALLVQMAKQDCDTDAKKKVDCRIASIKSFLGGWTITSGSLSVQQQDDLWAAFDPIPTATATPTDAKDALKIMTRFGKLTTEVVTPLKAMKPETLSNENDKRNLAALFAAAVQTIEQSSPVPNMGTNIHVIGAWYGDLGEINGSPTQDGRRFCVATSAVKAFCENKPQCFEPPTPKDVNTPPTAFPDGNIADITGAKLCGYEPAPFADPKTIGLVAKYQCVAITEITSSQAVRQSTLRQGAYGAINCQGTAP